MKKICKGKIKILEKKKNPKGELIENVKKISKNNQMLV